MTVTPITANVSLVQLTDHQWIHLLAKDDEPETYVLVTRDVDDMLSTIVRCGGEIDYAVVILTIDEAGGNTVNINWPEASLPKAIEALQELQTSLALRSVKYSGIEA